MVALMQPDVSNVPHNDHQRFGEAADQPPPRRDSGVTGRAPLLRLIGPPGLLRDGVPVRVPRRKALALLAYLAVQRHPAPRERLAALLWPDADARAARVSLRRALSDLNLALGEGWREEDDDCIALRADFPLRVDLSRIEAVVSGREPLSLAQWDAWMRDGMGAFMDGFDLPGLELWSEWRYVEAQTLARRQHALAARAVAVARAAGEAARALAWSECWQTLDPLDEEAFRARLRALADLGRQEAMPGAYRAFRERLRDELQIDPEPETAALFESLRQRTGADVALDRVQAAAAPLSIRYVRCGDLHLATRVIGERGPWLVFVGGFVSHLEHFSQEPTLEAWLERLARGRRVLLFDKRGMGLSDRSGSPPTPERTAEDLRDLFDAHGIDRAVVMGVSEGGPAALQFARREPARCAGLVLFGTSACWVAKPDYPHSIPPDAYARWVERMQAHWGDAVNVAEFAPSRAGDPASVHWWARMLRAAASPGALRGIFEAAQRIDCRAWLHEVTVPALVLQRRGDRLMRAGNGRYLAEHLHDARHVELPGADHWFWAGDTAPLHAAVDAFLDELALAGAIRTVD